MASVILASCVTSEPDMAGNVAEWVADWLDMDYYEVSPTENPQGPESSRGVIIPSGETVQVRVVRSNHPFANDFGGMTPEFQRTTNRAWFYPDKATASLIGDVSKGVMINQRPIFLGGQGGIAGPIRINYGNVVAAGSIVRKDILEENNIYMDRTLPSFKMPFIKGQYSNLMRIINLNAIYIANLIALRRWYLDVRSLFITDDPMDTFLFEGAIEKLNMAVGERVKRLGQVANQMPEAIEIRKKLAQGHIREKALELSRTFFDRWSDLEQVFREGLDQEGEPAQKEAFLGFVEKAIKEKGRDYLTAIKNLPEKESLVGVTWLDGLINEITRNIWEILPGTQSKRQ